MFRNRVVAARTLSLKLHRPQVKVFSFATFVQGNNRSRLFERSFSSFSSHRNFVTKKQHELVSNHTTVQMDQLGLEQDLIQKLHELGFSHTMPIQASTIPLALQRHDVLINAPTGTGKTLAFVLPILHDILQNARSIHTREDIYKNPTERILQACILVPNQELCTQIQKVCSMLLPDCNAVAVYRGCKILDNLRRQERQAKRSTDNVNVSVSWKYDIVVATPAAFLNLCKAQSFGEHLRTIRTVAVDEADVLLSASFQFQLNEIFSLIYDAVEQKHLNRYRHQHKNHALTKQTKTSPIRSSNVQYLFAAATMIDSKQRGVGEWLEEHFWDAKHILVPGMHKLNTNVQINIVSIDVDELYGSERNTDLLELDISICEAKHRALLKILRVLQAPRDDEAIMLAWNRTTSNTIRSNSVVGHTLVFANTFTACEDAAVYIERNDPSIRVGTLHKEVPLHIRENVVQQFMAGEIDVLIATDVIARGLDTMHVRHVVNLDVPVDVVSYIHRCGRTSRAGGSGTVTNIIPSHQRAQAETIFRQVDIGLDDTFSRRRAFRHKKRRVAKERKHARPRQQKSK